MINISACPTGCASCGPSKDGTAVFCAENSCKTGYTWQSNTHGGTCVGETDFHVMG